ncbi:MAG: hypothetical protein ACRBBP_05215 [Bdellovibrionales bacterium]
MDLSFKSLPPKLFSNVNSQREEAGILWLPPIEQRPITTKIDWLTGLQISNLEFTKENTWSEDLKNFVVENNLPLDEQPPFNHSNTLIFSLPKGFKASLGLIIKNSNWGNREDVYNRYTAACDSFGSDFFIQSLDFWSTPEIQNVEWVKV